MGKLLETHLQARLVAEVEEKGGLSDLQFGFRKGRLMIDEAKLVMEMVDAAAAGT